jgi:hypothetical protein
VQQEEGEAAMQVRRATSTPAAGSPRSSRAVAHLKHLSQARQPRHSLTSSTSHLPTTALDADERPLPVPATSRAAALDKLKQAMVKRHNELLRSSTIFQRCAGKHRLRCVLLAGYEWLLQLASLSTCAACPAA